MYLSKKLFAGIVAVVAIAAGTTAFAAIPGDGGVIHGCYDKNSGQLRVTDNATNTPKGCSSKEAALDWNQQGTPGPKGDAGVSSGVVLSRPNPKPVSVNTIVGAVILHGTYIVSAKVVIGNTQHEFSIATCSLFDGPYLIDQSSASTYGPVSGGITTIYLTGAFLHSGLSAYIECTDPDGYARDVVITGTQLDNVYTP